MPMTKEQAAETGQTPGQAYGNLMTPSTYLQELVDPGSTAPPPNTFYDNPLATPPPLDAGYYAPVDPAYQEGGDYYLPAYEQPAPLQTDYIVPYQPPPSSGPRPTLQSALAVSPGYAPEPTRMPTPAPAGLQSALAVNPVYAPEGNGLAATMPYQQRSARPTGNPYDALLPVVHMLQGAGEWLGILPQPVAAQTIAQDQLERAVGGGGGGRARGGVSAGQGAGISPPVRSMQPPRTTVIRPAQQPPLTSGTTPASRVIQGTTPFPRNPTPTRSVIDSIPSYMKPGIALAGAAGLASLASPMLGGISGQVNGWADSIDASNSISPTNPVYSGDQPYYGPRFREPQDQGRADWPYPPNPNVSRDPASLVRTAAANRADWPTMPNPRTSRPPAELVRMAAENPYKAPTKTPATSMSTPSAPGQIAALNANLPQVAKIGVNAEGVFGMMEGGLTPDDFQKDRDEGFVHLLMTDALAKQLTEANGLPAGSLAKLIGRLVAVPEEWASASPAASDTTAATSDTGTGTGTSTTSSSSGSGSTWVDYGSSGRSSRSGSGGRGYSYGYDSADGTYAPEAFFAESAPEGDEEADMWDNPIFARYFAILEGRYGREGAMRRMRGMSRRFRFGRRLSRSTRPSRVPQTREKRVRNSTNNSDASNVPTNAGIRKDVTKRVKKATK